MRTCNRPHLVIKHALAADCWYLLLGWQDLARALTETDAVSIALGPPSHGQLIAIFQKRALSSLGYHDIREMS